MAYLCDCSEESVAVTERLGEYGIVRRVSDAKRDRVFCAQALLEILEEPAHLKPETL
jgi:hypothetical protein